jgi:hypothetical protein
MLTLALIVAGIALWQVTHKFHAPDTHLFICRNCGSCDAPKTVSPRSIWIEIILWFSYLIPGVIYTLWCHYQTYIACNKCGSRDIVPLDSPVGRKLAGQAAQDVTPMSQEMGKK